METLKTLIKAYRYVSGPRFREMSSTCRLIELKDTQMLLKRLIQEVDECIAVVEGEHLHPPEKLHSVAQLLQEEGLPLDHQDLILELHQVSYWFFVFALASGQPLPITPIISLLKRVSNHPGDIKKAADSLKKQPGWTSVFTFIATVCGVFDLPVDIFARLDLKEMKSKDYLRDFFNES